MICVYRRGLGGLWFAAAVESESDRVFATNFGWDEQRVLKGLLASLPYDVSFQMVDRQSQFSEKVLTSMKSMVAGECVSVDFEFAMAHLPEIYRRVLDFLLKVPVGYVTTYGALADAAGTAPRVVGRVMATNPFAPLIPCHRVVGSDFGLHGYGGGLEMKWKILQREDRGFKEPTKIKVDGSVLSLFPVGFVRKD